MIPLSSLITFTVRAFRRAGQWKDDMRHGEGACRFADGTRFRGQWSAGGWVQSAACPLRSSALIEEQDPLHAIAGQEASFVIQVIICHSLDVGHKRGHIRKEA